MLFGELHVCDSIKIPAGDLALNVQPVRNRVVSGTLQEMEQRRISAILDDTKSNMAESVWR